MSLPPGYRPSAWSSLDEHSRALFLEEILLTLPGWEVAGTVDYSGPEPLLTNPHTGAVVTLAGEVVTSETGALNVPILSGTLVGRDYTLWIVAAVVVAALVLRRK